jgi:hypothetical protein
MKLEVIPKSTALWTSGPQYRRPLTDCSKCTGPPPPPPPPLLVAASPPLLLVRGLRLPDISAPGTQDHALATAVA